MKILVFLQGTVIMPLSFAGKAREERVRLSRQRDPEVLDASKQVPIGNSVQKLTGWKEEGARILYMSARRKPETTGKVASVIEKYGFPKGDFLFRREGEQYKDLAERIMPDIIVEDDCESLGGEKEMVYPHIRPELRTRIKSVVVKEFEGVDHLPDSVRELRTLSL